MKKIINKGTILTVTVLMLLSCHSAKEDQKKTKTNEQLLKEVVDIKAVGKVEPMEEDVFIAAAVTGLVKKIFVQDGDTVVANQLLIQVDPGTSSLELEKASAILQSLKEENRVIAEDIRKASISADELEATYLTSKKLVAQQAETKEKLNADYSAWQQQLATLQGLIKKQKAQHSREREQSIDIKKVEKENSEYNIRASKSGVISEFTAQVGRPMSSSETFGRIVNLSQPIVRAEVDELFAQDVKIGQSVTIFALGRQDTLARGSISHISPVLSNKSILYETANEGEDRRVRIIKIKLFHADQLIINAKVDCVIHLK